MIDLSGVYRDTTTDHTHSDQGKRHPKFTLTRSVCMVLPSPAVNLYNKVNGTVLIETSIS